MIATAETAVVFTQQYLRSAKCMARGQYLKESAKDMKLVIMDRRGVMEDMKAGKIFKKIF